MPDTRDKDIATRGSSAAIDDWNRKDGATNGTRRVSPFDEHGQFRNGLGGKGAMSFYAPNDPNCGPSRDGGSILAFGASDPICLSIWANIAFASVNANRGLMGLSDTTRNTVRPGAVEAYFSSNTLICVFYGATTSDYRRLDIDYTPYFGRWTWIHWDIRAGKLYINCLDTLTAATPTVESTGGTPPAWSAAITGTIYSLANRGTTTLMGSICRFLIWDMQPNAVSRQRIFERGGVVPAEFQWSAPGNCVANPAANSTFDSTPSWSGVAGGSVVWDSGNGELDVTSGGTDQGTRLSAEGSFNGGITPGHWARIKATLRNVVGSTVKFACCSGGNAFQQFLTGLGNGSVDQIIGPWNTQGANGVQPGWVMPAAGTFSLDDFYLYTAGVRVSLPLDDGAGFLARDESSNKLHGAFLLPDVLELSDSGPQKIRGTTSTNGNQQLYAQNLIPPESQILKMRIKPLTGTPTIKLGTSSGAGDLVASVTLTAGVWNNLTIVLTGGIVGASQISIWCNSNSTDILAHDHSWEPLSS